jgi:hypothetical protein
LTDKNLIDRLILAFRYDARELKKWTVYQVAKDLTKIISSAGWAQFVSSDKPLADEIAKSIEIEVKELPYTLTVDSIQGFNWPMMIGGCFLGVGILALGIIFMKSEHQV